MVMNIHSDASYLSETKARSRACGIFFMGWMSKNGEPNELNGALYVNTTILLFIIASAAGWNNFLTTLANLGHPQP